MSSNHFLGHRHPQENQVLKRRSSLAYNHDNRDNVYSGGLRQDYRSLPPQKRARTTQLENANPSKIYPYHGSNYSNNPSHVLLSRPFDHNGSNVNGYGCSNGSRASGNLLPVMRKRDLSVPVPVPVPVPSRTTANTNHYHSGKHTFSKLANPFTVERPSISFPRQENSHNDFDSLPEWIPDQPQLRYPTGLSSNMPLNNFVDKSRNGAHPGTAQIHRSQEFALVAPIRANAMPNLMQPNNPLPISTSSLHTMEPVLSQVIPNIDQSFASKDLLGLLSTLSSKGLASLTNEKQNFESDKEETSIGLEFDPDVLKKRHDSVINALYSDLPRQCATCGVRFKCQEDHRNHMDWHVRKNRMTKNMTQKQKQIQKLKQSRKWYTDAGLWLSAVAGEPLDTKAVAELFNAKNDVENKEGNEEYMVPADEDQKMCALCRELFEDFFSDEADDWMYKGAVYLNMGTTKTNAKGMKRSQLGPIVHVKCMPETTKAAAEDLRKGRTPVHVPSTHVLAC